jgi:hypothetical protein
MHSRNAVRRRVLPQTVAPLKPPENRRLAHAEEKSGAACRFRVGPFVAFS